MTPAVPDAGPPRKPSKGERTRARLFDVAVREFRRRGYAEASLRRIAGEAGVTPALLYRYFDGKEAVVLELYGNLLDTWAERSAALPRGSWTSRTLWLTRLAFEVLAPYRELLRVLAGLMVTGDPTTSPLRNAEVERVAEPVFRRAVAEAKDRPRDLDGTVDLAYLAHLGAILFWVVDRSPEQRDTETLLADAERLAPFLQAGLKTPIVGRRILSLARTLTRGLRGEATT